MPIPSPSSGPSQSPIPPLTVRASAQSSWSFSTHRDLYSFLSSDQRLFSKGQTASNPSTPSITLLKTGGSAIREEQRSRDVSLLKLARWVGIELL